MNTQTASPPAGNDKDSRIEKPVLRTEICGNCSTALLGKFCHECGQRHFAYIRPLPEALRVLAASWFSFDNKTLRSVALMLRKPGALTCAYISGKRASFSSPLRMYLLASLLFFYLLGISNNTMVGETNKQSAAPPAAPEKISMPEQSAGTLSAGFWSRLENKTRENPHQLKQRIMKALSYMFFVLMPLFALLLKWFLKRNNKLYFEHLIFSIHVHVFGFLFMSAYLIFFRTTGLSIPFESWVISIALMVYVLLAMLHVYGMGWWVAIIRLMSILAVYVFIFMIVMISSLVIAIII